jgi:glycosyltransferase involved in cell wall biosynthesis
MKRKKLVFVCGSRRGIGTYVRAFSWAKLFATKGFHTELVYAGDTSEMLWDRESDVELIGLPCANKGFDLDRICGRQGRVKMTELIDSSVSAVFGFEHFGIVVAAKKVANKNGVRFISDWADLFSSAQSRRLFNLPGMREMMRVRERAIRRSSDYVIVISQALKARALEIGVPENHISVLNGGAPTESYQAPISAWSDARIRRSGLQLLVIGSFLVEEILGFIDNDADYGELSIHIVGRIPENIINLFSSLEGRIRIVFYGYKDDAFIQQLSIEMDAGLVAMNDNIYNEARWPNKVGDYLALGLPVVCSRVGDVASLVEREQVGWSYADKNELFEILNLVHEIVVEPAFIDLKQRSRNVAELVLSWSLQFNELNRIIEMK